MVLLDAQGAVVSRSDLLDRAWGETWFGDPRTLDVHIRWLREKLEQDPSRPVLILTVRGLAIVFCRLMRSRAMTSPVLSPVQQTAARWPWQRNLQTRIVLTFTLLFLVVLALLMLRVSQSIYQAQLEASTHNLEIAAFLAANALEDPLSGYEAEFERFANWEAEQGDEKREKPSAGTDDHEGQEDQKDKVGTQAPMSGVEPPPSSARLQQIASVYAADTGTRVTILTPLGNALADSALSITQIGNQSAHIEVQVALQGHTQHDVRTDPHDGQPTLYAAAPIQQSGRTVGWCSWRSRWR
ncbi:helix-turn-helix domain-containing protein [Candidatus Amarobacter glycogenicus]|uniref:winged helix-turn-helix domain-containing protein n=1 Tax=Candidatus Amarobacter glycogenicus TaxID=3140699 RepID=UPI0031CC4821